MVRNSPSTGAPGTKAVTPDGAKMDDDATRRQLQTACCAVDKHPIFLLLWVGVGLRLVYTKLCVVCRCVYERMLDVCVSR